MSSDIPPVAVNYSMTVVEDGWTIPAAYFFYPDIYCNITSCPLSLAQITGYVPSLGGNVLYLTIFVLLLIAQAFFGIKHRTWGFLIGMIGGLVLEILGYASRVELNKNPFDPNWFKMWDFQLVNSNSDSPVDSFWREPCLDISLASRLALRWSVVRFTCAWPASSSPTAAAFHAFARLFTPSRSSVSICSR